MLRITKKSCANINDYKLMPFSQRSSREDMQGRHRNLTQLPATWWTVLLVVQVL